MAKKNRYQQLAPSESSGEAVSDVNQEVLMDESPEEIQEEPEAEKVDFDAWYAMRAKQIPRQHHKEIIKADFMARGLCHAESLADFDAALSKYGVKLN